MDDIFAGHKLSKTFIQRESGISRDGGNFFTVQRSRHFKKKDLPRTQKKISTEHILQRSGKLFLIWEPLGTLFGASANECDAIGTGDCGRICGGKDE